MRQVLEDLSDGALVQAVDANFRAFLRVFCRLPETELHDDPEVAWMISGVRATVFNLVLSARFPTRTTDVRIEETLEPFRRRGVPMMWWVGPSSLPADLGNRLRHHGLAHS